MGSSATASRYRSIRSLFTKLLQQAGYTTAYCGKWHLDNQRERPGFDYIASFVGQGKYNDCPIMLNGKETPTHGWIDDITTGYAVQVSG